MDSVRLFGGDYTRWMGPAIVIILLAAGIGLLLWWGSRLPPTRPRPGSRHRGETLMSVHQRLQKQKKRR